jgi:hypothetical protein
MRHVALCLASLLVAGSLLAQVGGTGSIQGTVTDPSGAVIGGASVTATNVATGVLTSRKTTDAGFYALTLLPAGEYTVNVTATGFEALNQEHVVVDALAVVSVNPRMRVGAANQSVTVEGEPSALHTEDVALGSTIENNVYDALPLAMNGVARDPSAFAGLSVGVNNYSTQAAGPSTGSFNGGQTYQNETYVEGIAMTSAGTEGDTRNLAFGISVEAVDQFQVETSGAKAMYEGQGMSNYVLKSGANQFHGGVFEYFRNTDFDARGFFAATTPIEHQNEFGGTVSGPIKRNKAFFFGSYDGYRYDSASPPGYQSIPTVAERTGDFSAFPQIIYDPTSATGTAQRTPFPNNMIPASRISTISQSLQSYLPAPTNGAIQNNYLASLPVTVTNNNTTDKVDYNLSEKNRLFGFFSRGKYTTNFTGSLTPISTDTLPLPYTAGRIVEEYATLAQIHDSYTITPNIVNQFSFSLSRLWIPLVSDTAGGNYPMKAGLTGLPAGPESVYFPIVSFAGNNPPIGFSGTPAAAYNEAQTTFTAQDNVLWVKGKHNVTFGFQFQALQDNETQTAQYANFAFSNNETAQFSPTGTLMSTTGLGYASYLLGAVDSAGAQQYTVTEQGGRYKDYAVYVQDDIKLTPKFTLNLGLRENAWSPFTEVNNVMSFLNPTAANPLAGGIPGALQFSGNGPDSCGCATPVKAHNLNLAPRIGLAWQADSKTVVRASYGIFYAHAGGVGGRTDGRTGLGSLGFTSANSFSSTVTGQPAFNWNTGFPANPLPPPFFNPSYGIGFITAAAGSSIGAGPSTGATIPYGDPNLGGKAPYYEDWSLNIQRALTQNLSLTVAYSASVGHFLPGAGVAGEFTNQIPEQYLPLGSLLTSTLSATTLAQAQAMFPNIKIPFPNFTGTIGQALKPFPQYGGVADPWLDIGNSAYNALQVSLNHRFGHGISYMINYTFSKELDDLVASPRDPNKNYLERAPGTIDHPNVAAATFLYQLPFGEGKNWNPGNKVVSQAVSHWQFSGIFTFSSGAPLTIAGTCVSGGVLGTCYPNYNPNFSGSVWQNGTFGAANLATTPYLNKAAFVDPPNYTVGNIARSAPFNLFAPHTADFDLSLRREFVYRERFRLAMQADAFNLNNAVHFAAPGTNIDSATFGIFGSMANQPRKLQLSARFSF